MLISHIFFIVVHVYASCRFWINVFLASIHDEVEFDSVDISQLKTTSFDEFTKLNPVSHCRLYIPLYWYGIFLYPLYARRLFVVIVSSVNQLDVIILGTASTTDIYRHLD